MSDASDLDDRPALLDEHQEVVDRPPTTDSQLPRPPKPSKKASVSELRTTLAMLGMDSRGKRETLYKRLLAAFTRAREEEEAAAAAVLAAQRALGPPKQPFKSYLCFDVEATCEAGVNFDYPNEIIEFPVVLLQWVEEDEAAAGTESPSVPFKRRRLVQVDTFHSYVRPTWRPILSDFCFDLTGIEQSTVDAAPTFPEVMSRFEAWLDSWDLREGEGLRSNVLWVTDGPWDLRDFIPKQLHITPIQPPYPAYLLGGYLNLKTAVRTALAEELRRKNLGDPPNMPPITTAKHARWTSPPKNLTIANQLQALGLGEFTGRQHSGIDDATNIARIVTALAERHIVIARNAYLPHAKNSKRWDWMGQPGQVIWPPLKIEVPAIPATNGLETGAATPLSTSAATPTHHAAEPLSNGELPDLERQVNALAVSKAGSSNSHAQPVPA